MVDYRHAAGIITAGAPEVCGPFGSYAEWSRMVRSPLVWLGEPDPVGSIETTQAEDAELADLRQLFGQCLEEFPALKGVLMSSQGH